MHRLPRSSTFIPSCVIGHGQTCRDSSHFLRQQSPEAIFLLYLGQMYGHHPMITFAPTIARMVLPTAHFVTQFQNPVTSGVPGWWARFFRKLFQITITGEDTDYTYGTLLRDSGRVIVLSDRHRAGLFGCGGWNDTKCELIPPAPIMTMCPDEQELIQTRGRGSLAIRPNEFVIVFYGYIYPSKGIETLLLAFQKVVGERRHVRLVIVGGITQHLFSRDFAVKCQSYEEQIKALAVELGVAEQVVWTGHCPSTEDQGSIYLRSADVCVLPFDQGVYLNNSSFSAAVTHGLATVTTRGDEVESPIVHERNVFLCPPKDPDAMAAALIMLIDNPLLRHRLQEGARDLAREWFSWDAVIQRITASFMREPKVAALYLFDYPSNSMILMDRDCFAEFILSEVEGLALTKPNVIARSGSDEAISA